MYKEFENPLPPKFGRMFVGNDAKLNQGPPRPNDTVTIRAGDSIDFYILVEECALKRRQFLLHVSHFPKIFLEI